MRNAFLVLIVIIAVLCAACQPTPVMVETPPEPRPDTLVAEAYLEEQRTLFEQTAQDTLQRHLSIYRRRGGRGTVGIYFLELGSGFSVGYEAGKTLHLDSGEDIGFFNTASVAKLPMAFVAYALADQGRLDLDTPHFDAVTKRTWDLRPMIHRMITHSINDYYNILLRLIGPALATETLTACGLPYTRLSRELQPGVGASDVNCLQRYGTLLAPRTTPEELGRLLTMLYRRQILEPDSANELLDALQNTQFNSRIPAGVGEGVLVAHKTGTSPEERIYNDAALVLVPENPFVLVILSKGASSHVTRTMRELAAELHAYAEQRAEDGTVSGIEQALRLLEAEASTEPLLPQPEISILQRQEQP